jgi:hypothetical protein
MHLMRKMRDRLLQGLVEPIPPYAAALAERCAYVQLTLLRLDQKGLSRKRGLAPSELRLYGALSGQYARMAKEISQLTPAAPRGPTLAEIFAEEGAA